MKNYVKSKLDDYGNIFCYDEFDNYHRIDGPAIECVNGENWWYINGKAHRIDGPACEYCDVKEEWWVNDHRIVDLQIERLQKMRKTINDDDLLNWLLLEGKLVL